MRRFVFLAAVAPIVADAAPLTLHQSGRLLGTTGQPLDGTHAVTITLYGPTGTELWRDNQSNVTFEDGYYTVSLGTDDTGRTIEAALHRASPAAQVGIAVDGGAELTPRMPFAASPLAGLASGVTAQASLLGTSCPGLGALAFDVTTDRLAVCGSSGVWTATTLPDNCASTQVPTLTGCRAATSCRELHAARPSLGDGVYTLDLDAGGPLTAFSAECDMTTAGGGWTRLVRSAPANTHPGWTQTSGYGNAGGAVHISPAWHTMTDFTEVMDNQSGSYMGGRITGCWTNQTMAAQVAKPNFTCTTTAVAGLPQRTSFQVNANQTHNGCTNLTAFIGFGFSTWDAGVSGSWQGIGINGYKTNVTVNCGTQCVKYSASCLGTTWDGTIGSNPGFWVR